MLRHSSFMTLLKDKNLQKSNQLIMDLSLSKSGLILRETFYHFKSFQSHIFYGSKSIYLSVVLTFCTNSMGQTDWPLILLYQRSVRLSRLSSIHWPKSPNIKLLVVTGTYSFWNLGWKQNIFFVLFVKTTECVKTL